MAQRRKFITSEWRDANLTSTDKIEIIDGITAQTGETCEDRETL